MKIRDIWDTWTGCVFQNYGVVVLISMYEYSSRVLRLIHIQDYNNRRIFRCFDVW